MNSVIERTKAKLYVRDLTGGGLLLAETRTVAESLLQTLPEADWKRLFTDENILKKNSPHTAIRYARTIKRRLEPLGVEFVEAVLHASESGYKQLLILSLMIHTPALSDFMHYTVAETKRVYKPNLSVDAWDTFLFDRSRILPGLNDLSEPTLHKSGSNIIRSLVEADYLDNNKTRRLQPVYVLPETLVWLKKFNRLELEAIME